VIGQLVERYRAKRTWARDLWHLGVHVYRKALSHTVAVYCSSTNCWLIRNLRIALSYDWKTDHEVKRAVEWLADLGYVEDQNGSYRLTPKGQDLYESIADATDVNNPDQSVLRKYLTRELRPTHQDP